MERLIIYGLFVFIACLPGIARGVQKGKDLRATYAKDRKPETPSIPHKHKREGLYESFSQKTHNTNSGAMPHKHETMHYTSMSDASKLPKGYILLNGEPVRVADLEDK